MTRVMAARIVAMKGDSDKVVQVALQESDSYAIRGFMSALGASGFKEVGDLVPFLSSIDPEVSEAAFGMFVKVKRADLLLPMLFHERDDVVKRARRYINEQGFIKEKPDS